MPVCTAVDLLRTQLVILHSPAGFFQRQEGRYRIFFWGCIFQTQLQVFRHFTVMLSKKFSVKRFSPVVISFKQKSNTLCEARHIQKYQSTIKVRSLPLGLLLSKTLFMCLENTRSQGGQKGSKSVFEDKSPLGIIFMERRNSKMYNS